MLAAHVCFFSFTVNKRERAHAAAALCARRSDSRGLMLRLLNGFPDSRGSGEFNLASACVSVNLLPLPAAADHVHTGDNVSASATQSGADTSLIGSIIT